MSVATNLIDVLPLPVLIIGADNRIVAANPLVEAILGPKTVGRHYITALRQPALLDAIERTQANDSVEVARFLSRDGAKDTTYRVTTGPSEGGTVVSFVDQTAMEEAGQARRDFVANVSHELRTPLTALLGFIETLGGAARDDAAARDRFLAIMDHEARRMTQLVDDLLSLSRVEEEARIRPSEHVDLAEILARVIKGLEPQVEASGTTLKLIKQGGTEPVPGDERQLVQVFTNLVENAIKYGPGGKEVTVTLFGAERLPRLQGDGIRICVRDQGEGIAAHHIPRLTERFYRVDTHRSREIGGTGLGLAIVKHIINRHRGRLIINSAPGKGTEVCVLLPTGAVS